MSIRLAISSDDRNLLSVWKIRFETQNMWCHHVTWQLNKIWWHHCMSPYNRNMHSFKFASGYKYPRHWHCTRERQEFKFSLAQRYKCYNATSHYMAWYTLVLAKWSTLVLAKWSTVLLLTIWRYPVLLVTVYGAACDSILWSVVHMAVYCGTCLRVAVYCGTCGGILWVWYMSQCTVLLVVVHCAACGGILCCLWRYTVLLVVVYGVKFAVVSTTQCIYYSGVVFMYVRKYSVHSVSSSTVVD